MTSDSSPLLFTPFRLREVEFPNRIAISPMCQYCATDGLADDWHLVHLGRFAIGGAGLVMVEATAVEERGRISHGDLGLYNDDQIAPLRRISDFLRANGSVPGIQLAHAGRKASMQRAWRGNAALGPEDHARGELPWPVIAPSPIPGNDGWLLPAKMTPQDMTAQVDAWCAAAKRAERAGFDVIELHLAHGYLLHSFLSPLSNIRDDEWGGSFENRCRLPLEIVRAVRAVWPAEKPLFVRISAMDGMEGGWELEDSLRLADLLRDAGVDLVDCSSGGLAASATAPGAKNLPRSAGFQVPYAAAIKQRSNLPVIAVGLILTPEQGEAILEAGDADMIAIGRGALNDPNWPDHARQSLDPDQAGHNMPPQIGWWLIRWLRQLRSLGLS